LKILNDNQNQKSYPEFFENRASKRKQSKNFVGAACFDCIEREHDDAGAM